MKRSLDGSGERPPITGTSKEVPPTWRSAIPVPESDSLLLRQSELDRARSEYRLGHYKEVLADLLKLIAKLEQFFTRTEFSADVIPYHLLYASTWATLGHTYRVLRLDENAAPAFERAVREFQEWIPRSTEEIAVGIHCDYGISLSEEGRIADAIQAFESGAKNGALSSEGYRYYAESVGKQEHVSHEQLRFAETQLRESLNLDSNDPLTHRALARNLEAQGKVDEALDCLRRAAALMVVNEKLAEAEATIGDALRLAPNDAEALGIRGGILVIMGRNGEALTVLEQSLTIAPDSGWVLGAKGQALAALGRDTEALDSLQHALQADSSLSWVHFESGVVLNKFGRNAEALEALDEAIKLSADYAMAFALKGYVLLDLVRREEAIDAFFQAVHLDPSLDWVAVKLAETLSVLRRYDEALGVLNQELELQTTNVVALRGTKADVLWDMGRHEEALKTLDQTLSLVPDSADLLATKGQMLRDLGRGPEAVPLLQRAVELDPSSARAWAELGTSLYVIGSYEEALNPLDRALQLYPDYPWILVTKGQVLRALGRDEEAIQVLRSALELDVSLNLARAELGAALDNLGQDENALAVLDEAIKLQPDYNLALRYKGEVLRKLGRYDEALDVLSHALTLAPDDPWLLVSKGAVLRVSNRAAEAVDLLDRALKLDSSLPRGWAELGAALYTIDRNEDALAAFDKALSLKPNYVLPLKYKGETLRFLGRYDEALQHLDQALALSPNDAWAMGAKGQTLRALGREADAAQVLAQAVKSDPDLSWAWADLGASYYVQERYEEASQALGSSLELQFDSNWALLKAQIHCDMAEFEAATELLERAIVHADKIDARDANLYGLNGWALENLGASHATAAREAYQEALTLQPEDLGWSTGIANSFYLQRKWEEAAGRYKSVLNNFELQKTAQTKTVTSDILSIVGWCQYRLGEFDDAIRSFVDALSLNAFEASNQFNLGLTMISGEHHAPALSEYEKGLEIVRSKAPPLRRGRLYVALDDLKVAAMARPPLGEVAEFKQAQELLEKAYVESKITAPPNSQQPNQDLPGIAVA